MQHGCKAVVEECNTLRQILLLPAVTKPPLKGAITGGNHNPPQKIIFPAVLLPAVVKPPVKVTFTGGKYKPLVILLLPAVIQKTAGKNVNFNINIFIS